MGHRTLRTVGLVCLAGLAATAIALTSVIAFGVPSHKSASGWLIGLTFLFLIVPSFVAEAHLRTSTFHQRGKRLWEDQMMWGMMGVIASFFYLLRENHRIESPYTEGRAPKDGPGA